MATKPAKLDDPAQYKRFLETATKLGEKADSGQILDKAVVKVAKGPKKTPKAVTKA